MIQTADDNPDWDPEDWSVYGSKAAPLHNVVNETRKERLEETIYRLDGDGVWTNQIRFNVNQNHYGTSCHYSRFQILTSERVIVENTENREPWEFIPDMETERL